MWRPARLTLGALRFLLRAAGFGRRFAGRRRHAARLHAWLAMRLASFRWRNSLACSRRNRAPGLRAGPAMRFAPLGRRNCLAPSRRNCAAGLGAGPAMRLASFRWRNRLAWSRRDCAARLSARSARPFALFKCTRRSCLRGGRGALGSRSGSCASFSSFGPSYSPRRSARAFRGARHGCRARFNLSASTAFPFAFFR